VIKRIYHLVHLLSLDVALGAMAGMYFFVNLLDTAIPTGLYLLLAMAVWVIYTLDHVLDTFIQADLLKSPRHIFHLKFRKPISILLLLVTGVGFLILFLVETLQVYLLPGVVLGFVILSVRGILKQLGTNGALLKEFSTACLYVAGISLAPIWTCDFCLTGNSSYFFIAYVLIAWLNLLVLSFLDADIDKKAGFHSILSILTIPTLQRLILGIGVFTGVLLLLLFIFLDSYHHIHTALLLLMLSIHLIQYLQHDKIGEDKIRQRLEASFLIPLFLILV
jgi:hypothetical protein